MSNNHYTPNSSGATPANLVAANTPTSQTVLHSTSNSDSPRIQQQIIRAVQSAYGQLQNPPRILNTDRSQHIARRGLPSHATAVDYPLQRAQPMYNQQQERPVSPVQRQYSHDAVASQPFTEHDREPPASVDASRNNQVVAPSTSYSNINTSTVAPFASIIPLSSSVPDTYTTQSSTTVDPMAVYDPWPDHQREEAAKDTAHAEEEQMAEEARDAEEAKNEEECKRREATTGASDALEAEIRAMMAKMRELNGKDPALLARIWEEERRAKASPKSPTIQSRSAVQTSMAAPAQAVQESTPQIANQRKKAAPKESITSVSKPTTSVQLSSAPATLVSSSSVPARPQAQATSGARHSGNTLWPPEKKVHLASVAATYLNVQNPDNRVDPAKILSMLDGNPSYIELCEQLEHAGLKLDRAAFAKTLLAAVPVVTSSTRKVAPHPILVQRAQVPPVVMKKEIATSAASNPTFIPTAASIANRFPHPHLLQKVSPPITVVPMAEMAPNGSELKPPANKEEAARKRNLSDLVDLTLLSGEEEDLEPPPKRPVTDSRYSYGSPHIHMEDVMFVDSEPVITNFPIANASSRAVPEPTSQMGPLPDGELRHKHVAEPLDKKNALRRNTYNPATIARDVLLACGRHPSERQLNQHLEVLRSNLPLIGFDSDLSTIRWDIIDPGSPPPGYFKHSIQALTEDADDEDDSDNEDNEARPRAQSNAIGGGGGAQASVQALPEATNPFKQKKRGRPPRHSMPNTTAPATPERALSTASMSASAPRPSVPSVGYRAFRSATEFGPDGQPLPKKRGRPVGWRKAVHGSASAQARSAANSHTGSFTKHQSSQPSSLRNVNTGGDEPILIESRSPSAVNRIPHYQSYKCKWLNCTAELHNLETLKKHVFKVHRTQTLGNTLECLWGDCGKEVTNYDLNTNTMIEKHTPYSFDFDSSWRGHIDQSHFDPLSWELGDGPASGLSGNED
jgi:hypothetical protein